MTSVPQIGEESKYCKSYVIQSCLEENEDDKIHLAWWIKFVDSSFAEDEDHPASVWIDAHSERFCLLLTEETDFKRILALAVKWASIWRIRESLRIIPA